MAEGACGNGSVPGGWRLDDPLTGLGGSLAEAVTTPCLLLPVSPRKDFEGEGRDLGTSQPVAWRMETSKSRFVFRIKDEFAKCVAVEPDSPESVVLAKMKLRVGNSRRKGVRVPLRSLFLRKPANKMNVIQRFCCGRDSARAADCLE